MRTTPWRTPQAQTTNMKRCSQPTNTTPPPHSRSPCLMTARRPCVPIATSNKASSLAVKPLQQLRRVVPRTKKHPSHPIFYHHCYLLPGEFSSALFASSPRYMSTCPYGIAIMRIVANQQSAILATVSCVTGISPRHMPILAFTNALDGRSVSPLVTSS